MLIIISFIVGMIVGVVIEALAVMSSEGANDAQSTDSL
jgi:hypothetical protein